MDTRNGRKRKTPGRRKRHDCGPPAAGSVTNRYPRARSPFLRVRDKDNCVTTKTTARPRFTKKPVNDSIDTHARHPHEPIYTPIANNTDYKERQTHVPRARSSLCRSELCEGLLPVGSRAFSSSSSLVLLVSSRAESPSVLVQLKSRVICFFLLPL